MANDTLIGFIGQGFVGKNYADDIERRGFSIIRYALEESYRENRERIKACDIVFIAVPTPTTPEGFDDSIVRGAIELTKDGAIIVIKSTILPGTTKSIQKQFPEKIILFSPEFLLEETAAEDAAHPVMNIIGVPQETARFQEAATKVFSILPKSSHEQVCLSTEAELFKYLHNVHGYFRVIFMNLMYDMAEALDCRWEELKRAMDADPFLLARASYYHNPVHKGGRGAGGPCYIKDFAAFAVLYERLVHNDRNHKIIQAVEDKNIEYLVKSGKSLELLKSVYGETIIDSYSKS